VNAAATASFPGELLDRVQIVVDDRLARHRHQIAPLARRVRGMRIGETDRGIGAILAHRGQRSEGAQPNAILLLEILDRRDRHELLPLARPRLIILQQPLVHARAQQVREARRGGVRLL
jgi:hypothetical protein